MRSWIFLSLLGSISAVLQCDLSLGKKDIPFPDIESEGIESYQMSVEYTAYGATQTDYYTEYYDLIYNQGRVDSHIAGISTQYVYKTASKEAWEINSEKCTLQANMKDIPEIFKDDQTDWLYAPSNRDDRWTVGPSAMFKIAFDFWNNTKNREGQMAYMGEYQSTVRGIKAQFWRRCDGPRSYVDYYFTADDDEIPFGLPNLKRLPLRVFFGGKREGKVDALSTQQYDINFQPYISLDVQPFQLPVGRGCKRGTLEDPPVVPDFKNKNLQFNAEVIYRTINRDGEGTQYWSYYSTLMFALDVSSQHLAYFYTPWSKTKTGEEPDANSPEHIIYDMDHGYAYKTSFETGQCEIIRDKKFVPEYKLPNNAGSIALNDPSILFPKSNLTYTTEGTNRGLKVNIFEEIVEGYKLNNNGSQEAIPKAIITHAYLQDDQVERNKVSVKNALAQVQLRFSGRKDMIEILTLNFFGFSTELRYKRSVFNIKRCFRNDDDYVWVTIGFNADKEKIQKVQEDVPSIESDILDAITMKSELNAVRIPIIEVDIKDGIYVTLMVLGKPPVQLDFLDPEEGQTVTGTSEVEGVEDFDTCATKCLETEGNCWGFSMCGAICYFGTESSSKPGAKKGCKLYRRYDTEKFIPSKELMVDNLRRQVKDGGFSLVLKDKDDNMVQIDASSIEVTEPEENDRLFNRIGNSLNPRMRVVKAGYKLKSTSGAPVKNMGKLRYDECQRLCLDFKDCETVSYCLKNSECVLSVKYADDINPEEFEADNMCNLLTRKYADNFERSPGNVLSSTAEEVLDLDTVEKCAKACLSSTKFKCLSFDHCPIAQKGGCSLHTVHYPNANTREKVSKKSTNCGHYFRKFSTEFKKNPEKRTVGTKVPPLSNLTLEECSKNCIEYGKGTCYGFDFCQGSTILQTSCILLDSDPSQMKTTFSPICTNFLRSEPQLAPRAYSNSYAGGIGFLCFLVGGILGAAILFGIAYFRVNRR